MSLVVIAATTLRNRDKINLMVGSGTFHAVGDLAYIEVNYGEFNEGDYAGNFAEEGEEEKFHYMVSMGAYFPLSKMDEAVAYYGLLKDYYERCDSDPQWGITSPGKNAAFYEMKEKAKRAGYSLDEIKREHQSYFRLTA